MQYSNLVSTFGKICQVVGGSRTFYPFCWTRSSTLPIQIHSLVVRTRARASTVGLRALAFATDGPLDRPDGPLDRPADPPAVASPLDDADPVAPRVHRKRALADDGTALDHDWLQRLLRRRDGHSALETLAAGDVAAVLGPGQALEASLRAELEAELGEDLGDVRVHTGLEASRLAAALEAHAFTLGKHIVMGEGWQADTPEGLGLLAHEATHVVQAGQGRLHETDSPARLDRLEGEAYGREADVVARAEARREATYAFPNLVARHEPQPSGPSAPAPPETAPDPAPRPVQLEPSAAEFPALRKDRRVTIDPVQEVLDLYALPLSREEFLGRCKDQLLELLRDELELENERRETLAWNPFLPQA